MFRRNLHQASVTLLLILCSLSEAYAQKEEGYRVEIIQAKSLKAGKTKNHQKLVGDVILKQKDVFLHCDSAEINQLTNDFDAWGHVRVNKSDSVKAWGKSLTFNGLSELGRLEGGTRLVNGKTELLTEVLYIDQGSDMFYYLSPAVITSDSTTITSVKGYYYTSSGKITYKNEVRVKHAEYTLEADTLDYYSNQEKVVFQGPTNIYFEKDKIYCESGYYNSKSGRSNFVKNAVIYGEENTLHADSIIGDENSAQSHAFGNVLMIDTVNDVNLTGHEGFFDQEKSYSYVTDSALFVQFLEGDTLYVHGDSIYAYQDSLEQQSFFVYNDVKLFKKDLQAVCDSLTYRYADSLIRLFKDPIVWNENSQLIGDSISLLTYDSKLHQMYIVGNSFIAAKNDSVLAYYDQIKGKNMVGYFKEGKLDWMDVLGNGQTIYFAKEEDGKYTGVNKAECSNIRIRFKENEIHKIMFLEAPEAKFYPLKKFPKKESKLEGFEWFIEKRPKSSTSLF